MWLLLLALVAHAGCDKDVDCKGDRICEEGVCTDPTPPGISPLPVSQSEKLFRLTRTRYRYGERELSWPETATILNTYTISNSTLRKGKGYGAISVAMGIVAGGFIAGGVGLMVGGSAAEGSDDDYFAAGYALIGVGMGVGLTVSLPFGLIGNSARNRAVARYNRAIELGKIHP